MSAPTTDGRVERRERNRAAVVEALLDLYRQGQLAPSADAIARQAGVSPRSLFRYFDDLDALIREAVRQQKAHLAPKMAFEVDPGLPFDERLAQLVAARLDLYEAMGAVARVARRVAHQQPPVADELGRIRAVLRDQVAEAFAPELAARRGGAGAEALAAADVLISWEAVDLLRSIHGLDRTGIAAALVTGLRGVLS
jgi:AcrR family transcriptional regulator